MPIHRWTLTDVAGRVWNESWSPGPSADLRLAGSGQWSIEKLRLKGGMSDGVDLVELNNGRLALSIVPTRGMGIWRGECDGLELGWKSPVLFPVHPAFVNVHDRGGIGWLTGFNEWICRCGLEFNGPPEPGATLHGRIANMPAHRVEASVSTEGDGTLSIAGVVDETTMFGPNMRLTTTIETVAGSNRFTITDEIVNLRGTPCDLELLYHINTGRPFLEPGARCVAPIVEAAPRDARAAQGMEAFDRYDAPAADYTEQVYFYDLAADSAGRTLVMLRSAHGDKGISIGFNKRELPRFTMWKNTLAEEDGYVTGLEPSTNFPNARSFERQQGRVISLAPGARYRCRLEIAVHSTAEGVAAVEREIERLAPSGSGTVHRQPRAGWSPPAAP